MQGHGAGCTFLGIVGSRRHCLFEGERIGHHTSPSRGRSSESACAVRQRQMRSVDLPALVWIRLSRRLPHDSPRSGRTYLAGDNRLDATLDRRCVAPQFTLKYVSNHRWSRARRHVLSSSACDIADTRRNRARVSGGDGWLRMLISRGVSVAPAVSGVSRYGRGPQSTATGAWRVHPTRTGTGLRPLKLQFSCVTVTPCGRSLVM